MLDIKSKNSNIQFAGRNKEIRKAQQILHKIKSDFPASSSFIANLLAQKRAIRSKHPDIFISLSDMMERYYNTEDIGAKLTNHNIASLRRVQRHYLCNSYKYCDSLVWGIKKFRAMNCKENAELAFLIAKMNEYKNIHCISLAKKLPNSTFQDLDHTVLLINQELPPNIKKLDKFYDQNVDENSAFIPSRKSIVIDPLFGIVDYWENALLRYKSIFPQMSDVKHLWAGARDEIIKTGKNIEDFRYLHPEFIIPTPEKKKPKNIFEKAINYLRSKL